MSQIENRKYVLKDPATINDADIDEWVDEVTQATTVTVVCDMESLRIGMGGRPYDRLMAEGDLAFGALTMANRIGRLCDSLIIAQGPKNDIDLKVWRRFDIHPIWPSFPLHTTSVLTTLRVADHVLTNPSAIYLWITAESIYLDLMTWMVRKGRLLACVVPAESKTYKIKEISNFVMDLEEVAFLQDPGFDIDEYDLSDFILLVDKIEHHLPFVGVQYFVERQMQKLGLKSRKTCHDVFHKAKQLDLMILGTKNNIDNKSKDVSTCKLNHDNDFVREVLNQLASKVG